jgi:hypothetical protein
MTPVPARVSRFSLHALLALTALALPLGADAQDQAAVTAYYTAVGEHFKVPSSEVMILSEWRLAPEDIPVVLFVAGQGGISPEAVVALRRAGQDWPAIARRYRLDAVAFHVPLDGNAGSLARVYEVYSAQPRAQWPGIDLKSEDIVALVNLRVLSELLNAQPAAVIQARDRGGSWVTAYRSLARR